MDIRNLLFLISKLEDSDAGEKYNLKTINRVSTFRGKVRLHDKVTLQPYVQTMLIYLYAEFLFFIYSLSYNLILS